MSINAINTNLFGISSKNNVKVQVSVDEKKTEEKTQTTQTENKQVSADDVFKYIPAECDSNVVYSKEPINVDVKPVPY